MRGVGDRGWRCKAQALGMNRIFFKEEQCPVTMHTFRRKELHKCRQVGVKTRNLGN
jgi:hypothetical protein